MQRLSTGVMVAGIVLTSLGSVAMVAGAVNAASQDANCPDAPGGCADSGALTAFMVGGLAGISIGIPMWIIGAHKVPVDRTTATSSGLPAWAGEPAGRGWRWQF